VVPFHGCHAPYTGRIELKLNSKTYLALLLIAALLVPVASAAAVPSKADKMAQARAVKSQINALDQKVEVATEDYNVARGKYNKVASERDKAAARVVKAEKRIGTLQKHLGTRAKGMYRSGQLGFLDVLLGAKSFEQMARTWDLLKQLNVSDAQSVSEMKQARVEAEKARVDYATKAASAKRQVKIMSAKKSSIKSQLAARKSKLSGLESEIAAIEAQEEARAAAAARTWTKRPSRGSGGKVFPPPTRAPRSEIMSIARRYLGAPYVWGADGPNTFDCSGFTMFVYRQVGVSLPHSSRAQIGYGQRVSRSDLKPGDLVFFGSPIHHVGIYAGGGMMIHAPHTGDVVKISPMGRGDFAGACRP
jgi:peptidoglycan DL-endopeptidase CwlO